MQIEVISHCFAKQYPHYADALVYQLSSLILDKPTTCDVRATICYDGSDKRTSAVLGYFADKLDLVALAMPISNLGRRAIGRNLAALGSSGDIVWFADCDQVYRDGILDRLAGLDWPDGATMIWPRRIHIHRDHATGDEALRRVSGVSQLIDVEASEFVPKSYSRAIGGVQIVRGDFAREHGYLDGHSKYQRPIRGDSFVQCHCDRPYRQFCSKHGDIRRVDLPGMYRIRHSESAHTRG